MAAAGTQKRQKLLQQIVAQLQFYELNSVAVSVANALNLDPSHAPSNALAEAVEVASKLNRGTAKAKPADESMVEEESTPQHPWGPCFEGALKAESLVAPVEYMEIYSAVHSGICSTAAWSRDGRYMATGSHDNSLKVIEVQKMFGSRSAQMTDEGKPVIRTYYDHTENVNDLAFHPNGLVMASCSDDCNIKLYDLQRVGGKRGFRFLLDQSPINAISFHPSGDYISAAMETGPIRIYDVRTLKCFGPSSYKDAHTGPINKVRYSFMGSSYVSCGVDGTIKVWDGVSGKCTKTIENAHHGTEVLSVEVSKNSNYALSTGRDSEPKLWDLRTGKVMRTFTGVIQRATPVNAVFSWNEEYVHSADEVTGDVVTWSTVTGEVLSRCTESFAPIRCISTSPSNRSLITCSEDFKARFYHAAGDDQI